MDDQTSRVPARICPPCDGECNQGRDCPAREQRPIRGAGVALFGIVPVVVVAVIALAAALLPRCST